MGQFGEKFSFGMCLRYPRAIEHMNSELKIVWAGDTD